MDREYVQELLFTEDDKDNRLIKDGETIDFDLLKIMASAKKKNIEKVFEKKNNLPRTGYSYVVEIQCPDCNSMNTKMVSKAKFFEIIDCIKENVKADILCCEHCKGKRKIAKAKQDKISHENFTKRQEKECEEYIKHNLSPNMTFAKDVVSSVKIFTIMHPGLYDKRFFDKIENAVKELSYDDFLKTPFWDGVRNYKLKKADYCCELCGGKGVLNVHHKTYENHGREFNKYVADSDLIVLCRNCHEKFHDKLSREEV